MAAVHAVGVPHRFTSLAMMVVGVVVLAGTVAVTWQLAHQLSDRVRVAAAAAALTAFGDGMVFWTLRHNTWGLQHSVGELQPDLVCGLPRASGELEYLDTQRYRPIGGSCFVRDDTRVDRPLLIVNLAGISPMPVFAAGTP